MQFTDFQKTIIQSISDNDINDYYTMATTLFEDYKIPVKVKRIVYNTTDSKIAQVHKKLLDYYYVCKVLEEKGLIQKVHAGGSASGSFQVILPSKDSQRTFMTYSDDISMKILKEFDKNIIIPSGELQQFIENNYQTKEELYQDRLIWQQEKSMAFTRKVALGSILLSVVSLAASIFLASNRKVEITNPGAFSNKVNVVIEKDTKKPTK